MLGPDITERRGRSHSHAGQLGPFQRVQMSQECAELGTTSLLPSPPPAPHPRMCSLKLCLRPTPFLFLPFPFHLSLGGPRVHCPSGRLPQSSFLPDGLKGSLKAGTLLLLQTPRADRVGWGDTRAHWEGRVLSR